MPTANNYGNPYYSFVHSTPVTGINWYRIKATPINNADQYSSIVKIDAKENELPSAVSIYPNPVTEGKVQVHFVNEPRGKYFLSVINIAGQTVFTEVLQLESNNLQKTIDLGHVATGNYQLIVKDEAGLAKKISFLIK